MLLPVSSGNENTARPAPLERPTRYPVDPRPLQGLAGRMERCCSANGSPAGRTGLRVEGLRPEAAESIALRGEVQRFAVGGPARVLRENSSIRKGDPFGLRGGLIQFDGSRSTRVAFLGLRWSERTPIFHLAKNRPPERIRPPSVRSARAWSPWWRFTSARLRSSSVTQFAKDQIAVLRNAGNRPAMVAHLLQIPRPTPESCIKS